VFSSGLLGHGEGETTQLRVLQQLDCRMHNAPVLCHLSFLFHKVMLKH